MTLARGDLKAERLIEIVMSGEKEASRSIRLIHVCSCINVVTADSYGVFIKQASLTTCHFPSTTSVVYRKSGEDALSLFLNKR